MRKIVDGNGANFRMMENSESITNYASKPDKPAANDKAAPRYHI